MTDVPAAVAAAVLRLVGSGERPVVLIDGGAGSGKTTLADALAEWWPGRTAAQVVGLDELYPGWGGLAAGSAAVPEVIAGSGFRTWDWAAGRPGSWRPLDPSAPLILEGCGAISPASRALAGLAVWLELDEATRKQRALARDGELFARHWDEWAAQEAVHWGADHPRELADVVLEMASAEHVDL
nr:cobalt ABC transporter [Propionicimonas sp.]